MPEGYGLLAETEGAGLQDWAAVEDRLTASRNYWIATTRPDGRPHSTPVWGVWHDGAFYFGTDPSSRKGRNLARDPHAVVHLESGDDVVILEGVVDQVDDPSVLEGVSEAYAAKYALPEGLGTSAMRLRPSVALAWREQDFPGSATRWAFSV